MNETLSLVLAWVVGGALGAMFFGGLWWTVRKGVSSERPALWFLGSALLRMGLALAGFYFVGGRDWKRLLLCLLGFIAARAAVTWLTRPTSEARHAS
jgi:F1F0 ATPase subunit 2